MDKILQRIKMEKHGQDNEFGSKVFKQFMDLFVSPEVKRRRDTGELGKAFDLRAAQIIFFPDGRKPQVRINSEVRGIANMKFKPGVSKKAGELVFEHEVEGLEKITLTEEDDPDCAHATLVRIGDRWVIAFDFRYNKALSRKHIEASKQFFEAAKSSFYKRHWSPFIDNLFSAAELSVRAILLSMPEPKFRKKASHKAIQIKYNRFIDAGNPKAVYRETFNKLSGLRDPARYLKRDISITEEEARPLLETVRDMIEDAVRRVGIR